MQDEYADQQQAYQEGQRQRFLSERYERLRQQQEAAPIQDPGSQQQLEGQTEGFMPDNEMTDYIQEEDDEEDPYYFVQPQERPHGDIYQAARVGDVQRVRSLVEDEAADVNLRDTWDGVPLYYACLAGHNEVVEFLLEAGAVCNEYTFDGDRCHYAALNLGIRTLLRQFEARPPPLSPLATSLRALCALTENPEAVSSNQAEPLYCDFAFVVGDERILLHRALLAARSKYFKHMLTSQWQPKAGQPIREVHLGHPKLSPLGLKALLVWMYTERLDVAIEEVDPLLALMRKCKLKHMVQCILKERRTLRYYFKSTRKDEAPRRFVLQPGMLPEEARLAHDLLQLRLKAAALEEAQCRSPAEDFADLLLLIHGACFRAHRSILAARSEFFRAFLQRSPAWHQPSSSLAHSDSPEEQHASSRPTANASQPTAGMPPVMQAFTSDRTQDMQLHPALHNTSSRQTHAQKAPGSSQSATTTTSSRDSTDSSAHQLGRGAAHSTASASELAQPTDFPINSTRLQADTGDTHATESNERCGETASTSGQQQHLPMIAVSDVTPEVFELVLEFVYSGALRFLTPQWLKAANTELLFEAADWYLMPLLKREVAEHIVAALDASGGSMDQLCRLLLAADAFQVVLLRNYCLAGLAQAFRSLDAHTKREQAIFEAFVDAVAPKGTSDLLDGNNIPGASKGNIEGGGATGLGLGTVLQDLRETYLEMFGGTGKERDQAAKLFDAQLRAIAAGNACDE